MIRERNLHPTAAGETRNRAVDQTVAVQEIRILHRGVADALGRLTDHYTQSRRCQSQSRSRSNTYEVRQAVGHTDTRETPSQQTGRARRAVAEASLPLAALLPVGRGVKLRLLRHLGMLLLLLLLFWRIAVLMMELL